MTTRGETLIRIGKEDLVLVYDYDAVAALETFQGKSFLKIVGISSDGEIELDPSLALLVDLIAAGCVKQHKNIAKPARVRALLNKSEEGFVSAYQRLLPEVLAAFVGFLGGNLDADAVGAAQEAVAAGEAVAPE